MAPGGSLVLVISVHLSVYVIALLLLCKVGMSNEKCSYFGRTFW
jgi:hypothetical protein